METEFQRLLLRDPARNIAAQPGTATFGFSCGRVMDISSSLIREQSRRLQSVLSEPTASMTWFSDNTVQPLKRICSYTGLPIGNIAWVHATARVGRSEEHTSELQSL